MASVESNWQKHKTVRGRRKLCGMEAADKWGLLERWGEKWERDGSHFTRCLTYGLICLLGLGNCASKQGRKMRNWLNTKYKPAFWEQEAGFHPHALCGISVHHSSPGWGNSQALETSAEFQRWDVLWILSCYNSFKFSFFQGLLTLIRSWFSKAGPDTEHAREQEGILRVCSEREHNEGGGVVNFQVEGVA